MELNDTNFLDDHQQLLIVEKWAADRGYQLDTPDFTDYVRRNGRFVRDFAELDRVLFDSDNEVLQSWFDGK